jgi:tetratricopeptide (TPR) repeat protein
MNRKQRRAAARRRPTANPGSDVSTSLAAAMQHQRAGKLERAEAIYRRILARDPRRFEALYCRGLLAYQKGQQEAAKTFIADAIAVNPEVAEAHYNLGNIWRAEGAAEKAVECYRQALALDPDFPEAQFNLGSLHRELGALDEAQACYEKAIAARPAYAEAHRSLAELKIFENRDDPLRGEMEGLLTLSTTTTDQRIHLHFALGKLYEDIGDYEAAFTHLDAGNRLKRGRIRFSIDEEVARAERIMSIVDEGLMAGARDGGSASELPVFIVGMPRSGTTLIEQILASHRDVYGAGELEDLQLLIRTVGSRGKTEYPEALRDLSPRTLEQFGRSYADGLRERAPRARRITDKMPTNFFHLGFAHLILPNAKIVHCARDPIDTCFSCYRQLFAGGQAFAYDLEELGRYYRVYERVMSHWQGLMPECILKVDYEDLVHRPREQTERLLEFCALPWDESCLAFHETHRPVRTASAAQVRQPMNTRFVGRSRPFHAHLGPLLDALGPLARAPRGDRSSLGETEE